MIRRLVLAIAIVGSMVIVAVLHVQAQAVATATPVPGTGNLASKPTWTSLKRFVATPSTIVVRRLAAITPKTPIATTTAPTPLRVQDAAAYAAAKNSPVGRQGVDIQPQAGSPVDFSYGALDARTADSVQGGGAEPPDTQMAVGRTQVFEMVNQTGEIFQKTFPGGVIGVPFALKSFFLMPSNYVPTDPRILYDYSTDRWYATMLGFDPSASGPSSNDSGVFLAISQTSDATGSWLVYQIYSGLNANADLTNLLCDQPKLGYSYDKFLVACTEFDHLGHYYDGVVIYTSKTQGLAGGQMAIGGVMSKSLFGAVPAQNLSAGNPAYVVENLSMGGAGTAGSWLITATGDPAAGPATFTPTVVAMPFTSFPPKAAQQGSATLIDTGDDRFMSAVVQNGELWTSGTEGCTPAGDTMIRSCMRLVQIGLTGATMDKSSTAGIIGKYIYYPTLSLTSTGDAIIGYSMSSTSDYPGFVETIEPVGASGHFYGDSTIVTGAQAYTGTRWGDYGAAASDPSDGSKVWVAGEWSNVLSGYNFPSWSTEIGRISRIPSLCVLTSFTTDVPPPQLTSTTVNLMAAAGCVTNATPEYSFWIKPPVGSWGLVQPYGSATTYAWSSHALGTYALEADVRAVGETRSYDTYIDISFVIGPCTAPSLSTGAATSPYPTVSGPTTPTATGSCSGGTQFEFWVRYVSTHWSILGGGYQSANTISWPANTAPGSYLLEVDLRPVGSSASYVTYVDSPPFFLAGCTLPTSLVATESSPQVAGTTVHWTASGACSGTPQYRFWVRTPDLVWHMLQDYNNSATFAWNSLNTQTGNYTVEVNVRNAGAIESFDTYTDVAYALGLCTAPTL